MPRRSQLANLLRLALLSQLGAALAWLLWRWQASPAQAVVGMVVVLLVAPFCLALEFLLLARVSRGDSIAAPGIGQLARAWAGEVRQMVAVFCWRQAFRWRTPSDFLVPAVGEGDRRGVVFVHGFVCNRGFWAPWLTRLQAQGRACLAVNLEPVFAPIEAYLPIIEAAVQKMTDATGAAPMIVCHSMGGVAVRAWLRAAGDASRVSRVVTIGSPHHGTWLARWSHTPSGRQMRIASPWLKELQHYELAHPLPPFTCWLSDCDNIVFPPSTAQLPQADNRLWPGIAHVDLAFQPEVMARTLELLDAPS